MGRRSDAADDERDEEPVTPGERLLYALGQLYRLWCRGELSIPPSSMAVMTVARVDGVLRDVELVTDGPLGRCYHFPDEVLSCDPTQLFPWSLVSIEEWALLHDVAELDLGL